MDYNSTHLLSFAEIRVNEIDIYEDAFGLYPEINDVTELSPDNGLEPDPGLVNRLIERIRKNE
jgi:hypothetical protein